MASMKRRYLFRFLVLLGFGKAAKRALAIPVGPFQGREGMIWCPERLIPPHWEGPLRRNFSQELTNRVCERMLALVRGHLSSLVTGPLFPHSATFPTKQCGVDFRIGSSEFLGMDLDEWDKRYLLHGSQAIAKLILANRVPGRLRMRAGDCPDGTFSCHTAVQGDWALRLVQIWDSYTDHFVTRFDVYYDFEE